MSSNGSNGHNKSMVFIQLTGGNDALNTVIPYTDGQYFDNRPTVGFDREKVLPLDDKLSLNPAMAPIKRLYDLGKVVYGDGERHVWGPRGAELYKLFEQHITKNAPQGTDTSKWKY